jgi:hypothetical protein
MGLGACPPEFDSAPFRLGGRVDAGMRRSNFRELVFITVVFALGLCWVIGLAVFEKRQEKASVAKTNDGYRESSK